MSVEVNIIFREKPSAIVVPAEAIAGDWVQTVDDGEVRRVPITVGIRGNRNTEIIGDVSRGTTVLSPARRDLADGARIRIDNSLTRAVEAVATSEPADQPVATPEACRSRRGHHIYSHGPRRCGDFGSHVRPHRLRRQRRTSQHHQPVTAVKLIFNIAWTHVSSRVRQTLVGMAGVSMGVGFTIMMAGLMQGSQIDFLRQLVDTMPHITVEDERRSVPTQPAEQEYGAVQMSDIANVGRRPGIKYPESVMSSLRSWIPGDVAPSVRTTAIINHGGARIGITLTGIDPRRELQVSKLAAQMREGKLDDLSRASNGVIIGEALAEKLGLKTGNSVLLVGGQGVQLNSTVTGLFRSGLKRVDESQIYSLMGPAQVMMGQSGVVNQLRLRLTDPMLAQKVAAQVEAQTGYKSVSWQEANADLLSTFSVRDFIVLTVMGAMLLTSSFATYNIISTITHEKRADIAIMKSLGMREHAVRWIFIIEAAMIGVVGILFGWVLGYLLCYGWSKITIFNPLTGTTVPLQIYYSLMHYVAAGGISLLCCAGAAYFPARKATRVHPVDIIRGAS